MNKVEKVKVLSDLFDLINMYYVARDLPNEENNFFAEVEKCCNLLDLDYTEFKNVFGLNCTL